MKQGYTPLCLDVHEKWTAKKKQNVLYSNALFRIKMKKKDKFPVTYKCLSRVRACSRYLEFGVYAVGNDDTIRRLKSARLCRQRFCPICLWRRSLRLGMDNYRIVNEYVESGGRLIFLTLTVPNCSLNRLKSTIGALNAAYARFRRRKKIKNMCQGDIKTIEITFNHTNNTFHPHIHVLMAVTADYFDVSNPNYVSHTDFQAIWQDCLSSENYIFVNVRAVQDSWGAIKEISKYVAKDTDYIDDDKFSEKKDDVLFYLITQTKGLRFLSYTGVFGDIKRKLGLRDIEEQSESELLGLDRVNGLNAIGYEKYRWDYGYSRYVLSSYESVLEEQ